MTNKVSKKRFFSKLKSKLSKKIKHVNMLLNGSKTILKLQYIFSESGVRFFFDMGTLLGIVREGQLLKHDLDIDIAVYAETDIAKDNLRRHLVNNGCKIKYTFTVDDIGIVEESYKLHGIKFDVNFYHHTKTTDFCYLLYTRPGENYNPDKMHVVELRCDAIVSIVQIRFKNGMINIPDNAESYLAVRYGENWRIPDKGYVYWKGNSACPIEKMGHQIHYYLISRY